MTHFMIEKVKLPLAKPLISPANDANLLCHRALGLCERTLNAHNWLRETQWRARPVLGYARKHPGVKR